MLGTGKRCRGQAQLWGVGSGSACSVLPEKVPWNSPSYLVLCLSMHQPPSWHSAPTLLNALEIAGTLTKNDMAVMRSWIAGKDFRDLRAVNACCIQQLQHGRPDPEGLELPRDWASPELGLDRRAQDLLLSCICLNSTANLRVEGDNGASSPSPPPPLFPSRSV